MNWAAIEANQPVLCARVAERAGVAVNPIVEATVRDTITALRADKIKELGGLEAIAADVIRAFVDEPIEAASAPVKPTKTKK